MSQYLDAQERFLRPGKRRFRSRHALELTYDSSRRTAPYRHAARCEKLMERIGATYSDMYPPRPKYMRRLTHLRILAEMTQEYDRMWQTQWEQGGSRRAIRVK